MLKSKACSIDDDVRLSAKTFSTKIYPSGLFSCVVHNVVFTGGYYRLSPSLFLFDIVWISLSDRGSLPALPSMFASVFGLLSLELLTVQCPGVGGHRPGSPEPPTSVPSPCSVSSN